MCRVGRYSTQRNSKINFPDSQEGSTMSSTFYDCWRASEVTTLLIIIIFITEVVHRYQRYQNKYIIIIFLKQSVFPVWNGYDGDSETVNELARHTALKRWIATEMRWYISRPIITCRSY